MAFLSSIFLGLALFPGQDELVLAKQEDVFDGVLKEAKLVFEDISGFYKLKYNIANSDRKQVVYIRKSTESYLSLKTREVFSIFYESETPPPDNLLASLFEKRFNLGGLTLEKPSETQKFWRIRYRMDILPNLTSKEVAERLSVAAATGDDLEKGIDPKSDIQ
jgi:hypothetical protein